MIIRNDLPLRISHNTGNCLSEKENNTFEEIIFNRFVASGLFPINNFGELVKLFLSKIRIVESFPFLETQFKKKYFNILMGL